MKNLLLAGLFLLALLAGCSKRKYETSVFGYVVEKNGSRKLAGAKVYLVEDHQGTYSQTQTYHDSTVSGPDGSYSFNFNYGDGEYRVVAEAENYYPTPLTDKTNRDLLKLGQSQSYNIELWAYAWLKLRFINKSGADFVNVNRTYGGSDFHIDDPDVTVVGLVKGNDTTRLTYFVYPGGQPNNDYIYCPGLDTTYHEITY